MPYRDGQAALIEPNGKQQVFVAKNSKDISLADGFTIEAYVVPRSVAETGAVRNIAAKWNGDLKTPGWTFGITGQGSRRKPMVLVLQTSGKKRDGTSGEVVMFADLTVTMNKPYFMSASVTYATPEKPGKVLFTLKDLSNDDEPLLTSTIDTRFSRRTWKTICLLHSAGAAGAPIRFTARWMMCVFPKAP